MSQVIWETSVINQRSGMPLIVRTVCDVGEGNTEIEARWKTYVENQSGTRLPFSGKTKSDPVRARAYHKEGMVSAGNIK